MSRAIAVVLALGVSFAMEVRAEGLTLSRAGSIFLDAREAQLKSPEGVACGSEGQLVVADTGNGRLLLFRVTGGASSGGTEVKSPELRVPTRVEVDGKGNILVLDLKSRKILRFDSTGKPSGAIEAKAAPVAITHPVAFKLDREGNVYVVDVGVGSVIVLDPAGTFLRQIPLPDGKVAVEDVYVDAAGVYAVDAIGAMVWLAKPGEKGFKPLSPSLKDKTNFPTFITKFRGTIVLVDQYGHGLSLVGQDGAFLGRQLTMGRGEGAVYYPTQACMSEAGEVFVADRGNNRVQVFTAPK